LAYSPEEELVDDGESDYEQEWASDEEDEADPEVGAALRELEKLRMLLRSKPFL